MRRTTAALAMASCLVLAGGCGTDDPGPRSNAGSPASSPTPTEAVTSSSAESSDPAEPVSSAAEADDGQVIEITFDGDDVTPNGDRVEVKAGEPIDLQITADAPGEIHVHSSPEQELEYEAGSSTLTLTIDQPGIVDVESHSLDKVIVQLQVTP